MASSTVAGASNWREAFEGHPGLAVTPENYDRLLAEAAAPEPQPAEPEPAAEPAAAEPPPPRAPKAEWVEHAVEVAGIPPEDAAAMTKADLIETVTAEAPAARPGRSAADAGDG